MPSGLILFLNARNSLYVTLTLDTFILSKLVDKLQHCSLLKELERYLWKHFKNYNFIVRLIQSNSCLQSLEVALVYQMSAIHKTSMESTAKEKKMHSIKWIRRLKIQYQFGKQIIKFAYFYIYIFTI